LFHNLINSMWVLEAVHGRVGGAGAGRGKLKISFGRPGEHSKFLGVLEYGMPETLMLDTEMPQRINKRNYSLSWGTCRFQMWRGMSPLLRADFRELIDTLRRVLASPEENAGAKLTADPHC